MKTAWIARAALIALLMSAPAHAAERFTVLFSGKKVGTMVADQSGGATQIVFDYKDNGRGPTIEERIVLDSAGLPTNWTVTGSTTFGSKVDERFTRRESKAEWLDATGPGSATVDGPVMYVAQNGSPYAIGVYARALLAAGGRLPALPGGELRLEPLGDVKATGPDGTVNLSAHALIGIDLNPATLFLGPDRALVGIAGPNFAVLREGFEGEDEALRALVAGWDTKRLTDAQKALARKAPTALRIANVRIFDPERLALSAPSSVLVKGNRIVRIDRPGTTNAGETVIDGNGGTLLAGFNEMHGHLSQSDALLNLLAGITTVRDMGNDDAVLDVLHARMDSGELAGPRVVRSAFIEGASKTNSRTGVVVDNEADAVKAVQDAAKRGVFQIKIYNSINPAWVPAMIAEARKAGLRVAGHIPAFTTTDAMLEAGYDEITHSNQLMLNWVLEPEDDTRTLLRITALKRFDGFDLSQPAPKQTLELMRKHGAAHDPTLVIMEHATLGRKGQFSPGTVDWAGHLPIALQRQLKQPMLDISTPEDDAAYRGAFDTTLEVMRALNRQGTLILPGTDMGGSFWYHRELELFTKTGLSNAQVLRRATYDSARYMGLGDRFGAVKPGLIADLVLVPGDPVADIRAIKTISMVTKDGTVYFPTEGYERIGIKPFTTVPAVSGAALVPAF